MQRFNCFAGPQMVRLNKSTDVLVFCPYVKRTASHYYYYYYLFIYCQIDNYFLYFREWLYFKHFVVRGTGVMSNVTFHLLCQAELAEAFFNPPSTSSGRQLTLHFALDLTLVCCRDHSCIVLGLTM